VLGQLFSSCRRPRDGFGVVGDGDVGVAHLLCLVAHLQDGVLSVGGGGVHLQVPADVSQFDQAGEFPLFGSLDLPAVLAELRGIREAPRL